MDWLCCFVRDKTQAEIIEFAVFSVCAARTELIDKLIVLMCAVFLGGFFLFSAPSILSQKLDPKVFCNIKTIFHILAERQFK